MNNLTKNTLKKTTKGLLISSLLFAGISQAAVVESLVGDIDFLGGANTSTSTSFLGPFDNRSAAELAATDGAQFTDNATFTFGTSYTNGIFSHSYSAFSSITSATWELGIGGLQSNNDALYLDGTLIASLGQLPDQGAQGYGIYSIALTQFSSLLDGLVVFDLDLNFNGTNSEPVVFDYAKLTINGTLSGVNEVPLPAAAFMLAPALLGFLGFRRKMQA